MRLAIAITAALFATPALAGDSTYTAIALAECLTRQTAYSTPQTGVHDLKMALITCAPLYRIHFATASAEGRDPQGIEDGLVQAVSIIARQIMER